MPGESVGEALIPWGMTCSRFACACALDEERATAMNAAVISAKRDERRMIELDVSQSCEVDVSEESVSLGGGTQ